MSWTRWALAGCLLLVGCASQPHGAAAPSPTASASAPNMTGDWPDATYTMTCDGVAPDGFRATLVEGAARVPNDVSQNPSYEYYDVRLEAAATGDLDGDGRSDTVVLLQCSPQPSNGIVEEVQVFNADGQRIGGLPSPRTLALPSALPPVYVPAGLAVDQEEIVAAMMAYGPGDNHATGPSVPMTVRWHWDGRHFVRGP